MKTLKDINSEISIGGKKYYIYLLHKPDGTPIYVGKGKSRRTYSHEAETKRYLDGKTWNGMNRLKLNTIKKVWDNGGNIFYTIDSWHDDCENAGAREKDLVKQIGRKIYNEGTLTNIRDGGNLLTSKDKLHRCKKLKEYYENNPHPQKKYITPSMLKYYANSLEINEDIKEELEELLSRLTRAEIIVECRISQSTLSRLLKKHNLTKSGYGSRKLNFDIAQDIRKIHSIGKHTQTEMAELFNVSQPTIHKVLNNTIYKSIGPRVTGEAGVKVGYNYR